RGPDRVAEGAYQGRACCDPGCIAHRRVVAADREARRSPRTQAARHAGATPARDHALIVDLDVPGLVGKLARAMRTVLTVSASGRGPRPARRTLHSGHCQLANAATGKIEFPVIYSDKL